MYQPFPIADISFGLYEGKEPWISPVNAFRSLRNARVFRGRILKRQGFSHFGILGTKVTTEAIGNTGNPVGVLNGFGLGTNNQSIISHGAILPVEAAPSLYNVNISFPPYFLRMTTLVTGTRWALETWNGGVGAPTSGFITGQIELATGNWVIVGNTGVTVSQPITISYEYNRMLPVLGIRTFVDATGSQVSIACDSRRLWSFNAAQQRFVEVGPMGAGVTNPVATDVWTGDEKNLMDFSVALNTAILNNNLDKPRLYDPVGGLRKQKTDLTTPGGAAEDIGKASQTLTFKARTIVIRPTESGVEQIRGIRFTSVEALETFRFGESLNIPAESALSHGRLIGDKLVLFAEKAGEVFELFPEADEFSPFSFRRLRGEGDSLSRLGGVDLVDESIIWGRSYLLSCNGSECAPFAREQSPDFVLKQNRDAFRNVFGCEHRENAEAWMLYTTPLGTYPTEILAVSSETGAMMIYEFPAHVAGLVSAAFDPAWNADEVTWEEEEGGWFDGSSQAGYPLFIVGDRDSYLYSQLKGMYADHIHNAGNSPVDQLFDFIVESEELNPLFDGKQPSESMVRLGRVDIVAEANPGATLTVKLSADANSEIYVNQVIDLSPDLPGDSRVVRRVRSGRRGLWHKIRLENHSNKKIAIDAVIPWFDAGQQARRR